MQQTPRQPRNRTAPPAARGKAAAAALAYLRRGWSVIPIKPRDKVPLIPWRAYQTRRPRPAEVRAWFQRWPTANVAIVTGAVSRLVVLDVDPAHGGNRSLSALLQVHGRLTPTPSAITGGGGSHLYFAYPGVPVPNRTHLEPGIDLRGDGGYVVAPPSVHPTGARYRWKRPPGMTVIAPMPDWLGAPPPRPAESRAPAARAKPASHWQGLVRAGVTEGQRNNTVASLAGHLLHHDIDPGVVLELLLSWNEARCRPPLPPDEVARTVSSIRRTRDRRRAERGEP